LVGKKTQASERKKKNTIKKLKGDDGVLMEGEEV
jgi:hypothetical protein